MFKFSAKRFVVNYNFKGVRQKNIIKKIAIENATNARQKFNLNYMKAIIVL